MPRGTIADQLKIEHRRAQVAANLLGGLSYRDMAAALHVSVGTIASDVKTLLERQRADQAQAVDEWRAIELVRLDRAHNAIWDDVLKGNFRAISLMLAISKRRSELLGLDERFDVPWERLTIDQVRRIADGEPPRKVVYGR